MVSFQKSFLLFYIFFLCCGSFLLGQEKQDSVQFYYKLVLNPVDSGDLARAFDYFSDHKIKRLEAKDFKGVVYDLRILAMIQYESGFYYDCEISAIEALTTLEKISDRDYVNSAQLGLYNQIGQVSRMLLAYDRALTYFDKALAIDPNSKSHNRIINNKGLIYLDRQDYIRALEEFERAYQLSITVDDKVEAARNLDNMGFAKFKMGRGDGLSDMQTALEKRLVLNDTEGTYSSYRHLFDYYDAQGDISNSEFYLQKVLALSQTINSETYTFDALSKHVNGNEDSLVIAYKTLNDKIRADQLLKENKYASRKYDYTQKELESQKDKTQKERWQMLIIIVLILVVFSYILLRIRHNKAKMDQVFITETRISKKIHDELANDVSDLMSYVENQLEISEVNKLKLLDTLEGVYVRTRDISTETASVDFYNFDQSLKHLLVQHHKAAVKVIINDVNTINWKKVPNHKKLAVYRVLQELMVNMKKHSNATLVSVVFKKHKNKNEIWYSDDGKGCHLEESSLNGLTNADYRIKEIGGKLTFETSEGRGFKAFIIFN